MRAITAIFAIVMVVISGAAALSTAHQFSFTSLDDGGPLPLAQFEGKALLVVNTASLCGFTRQYSGLQTLWETYRDRGLVVLGVPSNDFGGQEPGSTEEIKTFCEVNFGIDFPMTEKVAITGAEMHPFYQWARDELGAREAPRWNFHKYLISPSGALIAAFPSAVEPDDPRLLTAIEAQLL